jgi:hypothetical protein
MLRRRVDRGYRHDAFISYRHAEVDARVAAAIQSGLHRLAKRWFQVHATLEALELGSLSVGGDHQTRGIDFDGRGRVHVHTDGDVTTWDTSPRELMRRICSRTSGPPWEGDWNFYLPGRAYEPPC